MTGKFSQQFHGFSKPPAIASININAYQDLLCLKSKIVQKEKQQRIVLNHLTQEGLNKNSKTGSHVFKWAVNMFILPANIKA